MGYTPKRDRKFIQKSKFSFILAIAICLFLLYATFFWVLPIFIGGLGQLTSSFKPAPKPDQSIIESATLAPPVINIPFESTNTATINLNGYAVNGSKVKIYVGGQLASTVDIQGDGTFTANNIPLSIGTNDITGKTVDKDNRESLSSDIIKIIYNKDKPKLTISEPQDGSTAVGDRKIKVSGQTDPNMAVFVNDNRVIVDFQGKFSTYISLNTGDNNITIKAQDSASNTTTEVRKVTYQPPSPSPNPTDHKE